MKGLDKLLVFPTCLPVAHQAAINIRQVSLVSNRKRICKWPCERFRRGFSCEYLLAQVCDVMLLSHKCSCQRNFAHLKRLGNKQSSVVKNTSKADQRIIDGKKFTENDPDRVTRSGLVPTRRVTCSALLLSLCPGREQIWLPFFSPLYFCSQTCVFQVEMVKCNV